jgi:hypothetical protein
MTHSLHVVCEDLITGLGEHTDFGSIKGTLLTLRFRISVASVSTQTDPHIINTTLKYLEYVYFIDASFRAFMPLLFWHSSVAIQNFDNLCCCEANHSMGCRIILSPNGVRLKRNLENYSFIGKLINKFY